MGRTQGQKRKAKDPNRPKRPTSAYFYYADHVRQQWKAEGKKYSNVGQFTKMVSQQWQTLSEEEKAPFNDRAAADKNRFANEMGRYKGTGIRDPNQPKRPQSSYFLFLADFRKRMAGRDIPNKELLSMAGQAWKNVIGDEKMKYEKLAQVEKGKYEEAMKEYSVNKAKKARIDGPPNMPPNMPPGSMPPNSMPPNNMPPNNMAPNNMPQGMRPLPMPGMMHNMPPHGMPHHGMHPGMQQGMHHGMHPGMPQNMPVPVNMSMANNGAARMPEEDDEEDDDDAFDDDDASGSEEEDDE